MGNFYGGFIFSIEKLSDGHIGFRINEGKAISWKEFGDTITVKIDKNGNLLEHKVIGAGQEDYIKTSSETTDSGIIGCGRSSPFRKGYERDFFVTKFDNKMNLSRSSNLMVNGSKYLSADSTAKVSSIKPNVFKINFTVDKTNTTGVTLNPEQKIYVIEKVK